MGVVVVSNKSVLCEVRLQLQNEPGGVLRKIICYYSAPTLNRSTLLQVGGSHLKSPAPPLKNTLAKKSY